MTLHFGEIEQTVQHLLFDCPIFERARLLLKPREMFFLPV
jgi:hypothetical protein